MVEESLWKILAFLLAVVLIFIAPTIAVYDRMDAITYTIVQNEVTRFCDGVRDTGYVSEQGYRTLNQSLSSTGLAYDVKLEHYEKNYVPVYSGATFMDRYEIVYEGNYNDVIYEGLETPSNMGQYDMSVGDLFYIEVTNKSATKSQTIRQLLLGLSQKYPVIVVRSGGMVRHESD